MQKNASWVEVNRNFWRAGTKQTMKIGTITFHWGTNYGAVLQAYALQQHLKNKHYQTEIINYVPLRVKFIQTIVFIKNFNLSALKKDHEINKFRWSHLDLSERTYYTNASLIRKCHDYDIYICGSDQVWNESFTLSAEGKPTLSYYLNFVREGKTRISYATSFGTEELSTKVVNLIKPELKKFSNISVRENSGKKIVQDMGLEATLVIDPTLLLERESYERLIENKTIKDDFQLFSYILHDDQTTAHSITDYIFEKYFDKRSDKKYDQEPIGIIEWLFSIKNARFVVTNSFHGLIFSLIFHTPFIIVPVENSGMNDRIVTLLDSVSLSNRIVAEFYEDKIDTLFAENINWNEVDEKIQAMRTDSINFLENALGAYCVGK